MTDEVVVKSSSCIIVLQVLEGGVDANPSE